MFDDRAAHHDWLAAQIESQPGAVIVDLGCGAGHDLQRLTGQSSDEALRLIGLDHTEAAERAVGELAARDPRITFRREQLADRLPFADASVDIVYSNNLLECLAAPRRIAMEIARILRPGGQVVIGHWDWDTQVYDAPEKALVRRLVTAFADWQQAWMPHADGWMGRRLWGTFNGTSLFDGRVVARVLTNTTFAPGWFGHENAKAMEALVRRALIPSHDYEQFMAAQLALHAEGRYFYSITGYAYVGRRRAS